MSGYTMLTDSNQSTEIGRLEQVDQDGLGNEVVAIERVADDDGAGCGGLVSLEVPRL